MTTPSSDSANATDTPADMAGVLAETLAQNNDLLGRLLMVFERPLVEVPDDFALVPQQQQYVRFASRFHPAYGLAVTLWTETRAIRWKIEDSLGTLIKMGTWTF